MTDLKLKDEKAREKITKILNKNRALSSINIFYLVIF